MAFSSNYNWTFFLFLFIFTLLAFAGSAVDATATTIIIIIIDILLLFQIIERLLRRNRRRSPSAIHSNSNNNRFEIPERISQLCKHGKWHEWHIQSSKTNTICLYYHLILLFILVQSDIIFSHLLLLFLRAHSMKSKSDFFQITQFCCGFSNLPNVPEREKRAYFH